MQSSLGRRKFLGMSLALAASLKSAEPNASFPTAPRERLSVSTYPFRSVIASSRHRGANKSGMTLQQFADTVLGKFNVPGIEPWSPHFQSVETGYITDLGRSFQKAGLRVVNIPVDEPVHLCSDNPAEREAAMTTLHKWVDAAVILGSAGIRVHLPRGKNADDTDCATQTLKTLADYGASKNIVVNLENDAPQTENPERILKVLEVANTPYLRSLPDFCNSMLINGQPEYNYKALQNLFPHAYNISHVKDQESDEGKTYRVDLDRIFAIAKKAGYRGYFSMEFEGTGDPYDGTKALLEASLKNLA